MSRVNIINKSIYSLPKYESLHAAGLDLKAMLNDDILIEPGNRTLIGTGLYIELPIGYEAQIRPRSGLALKHGLTVLNAPGTIDSDYRGEIKVLLINHGLETVTIHPGDRIAQMIISKFECVELFEVSELSTTERNEGGYGHTGTT